MILGLSRKLSKPTDEWPRLFFRKVYPLLGWLASRLDHGALRRRQGLLQRFCLEPGQIELWNTLRPPLVSPAGSSFLPGPAHTLDLLYSEVIVMLLDLIKRGNRATPTFRCVASLLLYEDLLDLVFDLPPS